MFIEWGRSNLLKIHNFSTTVENLSLWKTGASLAQKENMQPPKNVIQVPLTPAPLPPGEGAGRGAE